MAFEPGSVVLLVGRQKMLRELIVQHLQLLAPDLIVLESELDPLTDLDRHIGCKLIVYIENVSSATEFLDTVYSLRGTFPGCPMAIISDRYETPTVFRAFEAGVKGFIPTSMGVAALAPALRLLLAGGDYMPLSAVLNVRDAAEPAPVVVLPHSLPTQNKPLSHREKEVLALLCQGKQNKVIAAELQMQEGTVKVHLRNLMRKFGVRSRLEIVLAALPSHETDTAAALPKRQAFPDSHLIEQYPVRQAAQ